MQDTFNIQPPFVRGDFCLELTIWLLEFVLFRFKKLYFLAGGDGADGVFIDQLIRLSSEDDTEIVEAENHSLHFVTRGQFDHHVFPVTPDPIEKLILDVHLILHHAMGPPLSQKDLTSRNIFLRSADSSHQ